MLDVAIQSKSYRTAKGGPLKAIDSIAFQVPDGEFACLVGPSGCGKTTALRLILGLDRDFERRIRTPPGRVEVRPVTTSGGRCTGELLVEVAPIAVMPHERYHAPA